MNTWLKGKCRTACINTATVWGIVFAIYAAALVYGAAEYAVEAIWGVILIVIFLIWGLPSCKYLRNIDEHPAVRRAASWGDPIGRSVEMKSDYETPKMKNRKGNRLSDHYIFRAGIFSFNVIRIEDIAWAYKKIIKKRLNFIIPIGKDYEAVFVALGGDMECAGSQKFVDEALQFVSSRNRWALCGYTDEIAAVFKQNPKGFAATVINERSGKTG